MAGGAVIVAGFGFRAAASVASLKDALSRAADARPVGCLATAADKAEAPAFRRLVADLRLPFHGVDGAALAAQQTLTRSQAALAARSTGSVAEAAALAAAGPGARLLAPRVISRDGTAACALAEGEGP
jgi:cobalt-precorrin 5A hydrolase